MVVDVGVVEPTVDRGVERVVDPVEHEEAVVLAIPVEVRRASRQDIAGDRLPPGIAYLQVEDREQVLIAVGARPAQTVSRRERATHRNRVRARLGIGLGIEIGIGGSRGCFRSGRPPLLRGRRFLVHPGRLGRHVRSRVDRAVLRPHALARLGLLRSARRLETEPERERGNHGKACEQCDYEGTSAELAFRTHATKSLGPTIIRPRREESPHPLPPAFTDNPSPH